MITLNFPLNIRLNATRPIFRAQICNKDLLCLLDTGAHIPIYCKGEQLFNIFTHDITGVSPYKSINIGGFGAKDEKALVYNFDSFSVGDGMSAVDFKCCKVAVMEKSTVPCDLILPISLFIQSELILDYSKRKKFIKINCSQSVYGVGYFNPKNSIYVFQQ